MIFISAQFVPNVVPSGNETESDFLVYTAMDPLTIIAQIYDVGHKSPCVCTREGYSLSVAFISDVMAEVKRYRDST
jgi:hypothetical protein